jgi:hypothetical protein
VPPTAEPAARSQESRIPLYINDLGDVSETNMRFQRRQGCHKSFLIWQCLQSLPHDLPSP